MRHIGIMKVFPGMFGKKAVCPENAPSAAEEAGIRNGRLIIPEGTEEISDRQFDRFIHRDMEPLISVHIPGTVRRIGFRAFANCDELEEVILSEGIEIIEGNAFIECKNLKKITLPGSVRQIEGSAFYNSGLQAPVISADGRTFIYYPQTCADGEYAVSEGIEEIGPQAFIDMKGLTKLSLPRSLKRIRAKAFYDCGFREIEIPDGAEIEEGAFVYFKSPVRIIRERKRDPLAEKLEHCRANGISFLRRGRMKPPEDMYWKKDEFRALARQCAEGSREAMERMAEFFFGESDNHPETMFYRCAAQFWQVRAFIYGSEKAEQSLHEWCADNPELFMISPCIDEKLCGSGYGEDLNALGFMFFEAGREYSLSGKDGEGVVEVSAWESEEGPDSDGYGREEFYDWWYLDEHLSLPEGIGYIHSYSYNDKRCNEAKFRALHDRAAAGSIKN